MKNFKSYLSEMVWYNKTPRRLLGGIKRQVDPLDIGPHPDSIHYSTMAGGHKIYKHFDGDQASDYHVRSPDGKEVHFTMRGIHEHGIFKVISSNKWNSAPAHFGEKVYHHLIMNHHPILSGSTQNTGSRNIWNKLRKKSDIEVVGYDTSTEKELPHRQVYSNSWMAGTNSKAHKHRGQHFRLLARKKFK